MAYQSGDISSGVNDNIIMAASENQHQWRMAAAAKQKAKSAS